MEESSGFVLLGMRDLGRIYSTAVTYSDFILDHWLLCGEWIERVKSESRVISLEDPSRQDVNKQSLQAFKNQKRVWKKIHQKAYKDF